MDDLERLLYLRGIALEFIDYSGSTIRIRQSDRIGILQALGVDTSDPVQVRAAAQDIDTGPWTCWLRPLHVLPAEQAAGIDIRFAPEQIGDQLSWELRTESGQRFQGQLAGATLPEYGEYYLEGRRFSARRLELPALPVGYHKLQLYGPDTRAETIIAAVPDRCYQADWSVTGERIWGLTIQLYTLRRSEDWGIGDFAALEELVSAAAARGASLIGLNPLHALDIGQPEHCSPYSPGDRRWINPLYIAPERVVDFRECAEMASLLEELAETLTTLRTGELIDYPAVARLKYRVYTKMYRRFVKRELSAGSARGKDFIDFIELGGDSLADFSRHESARAAGTDEMLYEPRFHQYLQWLADRQLRYCQQQALDAGMQLGLMRDLAVGAVSDGAEVTTHPEWFCGGASIGAPPDAWAPQGQNWGLVPIDPLALRERGYSHFINLLRSNMRHCGALRIDHVMGLMRLWWCPRDPEHGHGAYVHYPVDELFALLRLESQRNRCMVIGEDLGVVPPEIRPYLWNAGIYTNALFYFEKDGNEFRRPEHYPGHALAMVANHDVPTLAAWWCGSDLHLRRQLGLIANDTDFDFQMGDRDEERKRVLRWLSGLGLLPESWAEDPSKGDLDSELCAAILAACSRCASQVLTVQAEDLCLEERPVNIPGTSWEYPNWRRRLAMDCGELLNGEVGRSLLQCIAKERGPALQ